jgi:hypothetical protein
MADKSQRPSASEREISVDLNAADESKAVTRRAASDIASSVRDDDAERPRTKAEKELFKRMGRLERNLERQFDQRMAARDAEHQRELSDMRARLEKVSLDRGGSDDAADAAHEAAMSALKDKLAVAYEKGDSQASADITLQISKLDAQFWGKKAQAAGVTTRDDTRSAATTTQAAAQSAERLSPQARGRAEQGPTAAGGRFIKANEDWWDDPEFSVEQGAANTIYLQLVNKEGFDPKSEETYKEIAKQMKGKFPKLSVSAGRRAAQDDDGEGEVQDDEGQDRQQGQRRQAAAARIDDRGQASARDRGRGTSRTLTKQEIETMKACRLDPDNDKDVVTFLREAVSLEAAT